MYKAHITFYPKGDCMIPENTPGCVLRMYIHFWEMYATNMYWLFSVYSAHQGAKINQAPWELTHLRVYHLQSGLHQLKPKHDHLCNGSLVDGFILTWRHASWLNEILVYLIETSCISNNRLNGILKPLSGILVSSVSRQGFNTCQITLWVGFTAFFICIYVPGAG